MYISKSKNDINNEVEENTISCIEDVTNYIKAFYGDIYGNLIYNWKILNKIRNECINFRIDNQSLGILINIISMNFNIIETETSLTDPVIYSTYKLEHKTKKTNIITIRALILNKKIFRCLPPDFDIDLITEDNTSMYIRCVVPLTRFIIDSISHIKKRIINKRFCTLHRIYPIKISTDVAKTVDDAIELVKDGWIMDDNLLGSNAWIVVRWGEYSKNPKQFRTKGIWNESLSISKEHVNCSDHLHDNLCSLCHEKFKNDEIIFSTSCCHNFHWECSNDNSNNGLKNWVYGQGRLCCPYCRSIMF